MRNWIAAAAVTTSLLVVTACGSSSESAAEQSDVALGDYMITPMDYRVGAGTVEFNVTNAGETPHNFSIRDSENKVLVATKDLNGGQAETVSAKLSSGTYMVFCGVAGHESLGMRGTLTVD